MTIKDSCLKPPVLPPNSTISTGGSADDKSDMYYVSRMLKAAQIEGVIIEVVTSFGDYRSSGDGVRPAATCALYDWDVPIPF